MSVITINKLSKKYEDLYKEFEIECKDKTSAFYAVNNAIVFCFFLKDNVSNNVDLNKDLEFSFFEENIRKIENDYATSIFFNNVKKTDSYKRCLMKAVEIFSTVLFDNNNDWITTEKMLGNVLEKHINRKETGSYYTPEDTTRYIAWNSILMSIINQCDVELKNCLFSKICVKSIREILNHNEIEHVTELLFSNLSELENIKMRKVITSLKVIDPTCGSGAFIISAFEYLEKIYKLTFGNHIPYSSILQNLYGLDISSEAIQLTKLRLLIKLANQKIKISNFNELFNSHFIVANALEGSDYVIEEPGFDWRTFGTSFDCIIGNPPYVESKQVSDKFKTKKSGNLYAYVIERACNISKEGSIVSFVVPLSLVTTPRMNGAKTYLESFSKYVMYSTFADRPGCIFTGVHQRLTIFFAEIGQKNKLDVYTSSYNYWYKEEREKLFKDINYYMNTISTCFAKVGNSTEESILNKIICSKNSISDLMLKDGEYKLYLSTRIGFWTKAFSQNRFTSKEYKVFCTNKKNDYVLLLSLLNSSTFYFYWVLCSDCWHITNANLEGFKFNYDNITDDLIDRLDSLNQELMIDLEKNKKYIGSKQTEYEYKHKYSKEIIDKIDDCISILFDFDCEEIEYVKRFTEKYRVNKLEE